jgi:hypothetical protein
MDGRRIQRRQARLLTALRLDRCGTTDLASKRDDDRQKSDESRSAVQPACFALSHHLAIYQRPTPPQGNAPP